MMRHLTWLVLAGLMLAPAAFAQEEPEPMGPEQMEQHARRMELRERQAEMALRQRQREIELERMEHRLAAEREEHEVEMAERAEHVKVRRHERKEHCGGLILLWILVVNILLTIWVYKDMHAKKIARALWVPIVLLTGLGGALIYAVVRLGEAK